MVKRAARVIFEKYSGYISTDFDKNKELVAKILDVESKPLRNAIAGYLTSYAKRLLAESAGSEEGSES